MQTTPVRRNLWTVWAMLLASVLVYGAMPRLMPPPPDAAPPPESLLVAALTIVAFFEALATLVIRRLVLVAPARAGTLDPRSAAGAGRVFTFSLICWVLSVSIAIYGLVLFVLFRVPGLLYPFVVAAIVLLLVHAPRALPAPEGASGDLARPDLKIG